MTSDERYHLTSISLHWWRPYRDLRETLLPQNILHDNSLRIEDKVTQILSDIENVKSVAKFIYQAFEDRKISLEVLSFINSMTDYVDKYIADASNPQKNSYVVKNSSEDGLKITLSREKKSSYVVQSSTEDGLKIILSRISSWGHVQSFYDPYYYYSFILTTCWYFHLYILL